MQTALGSYILQARLVGTNDILNSSFVSDQKTYRLQQYEHTPIGRPYHWFLRRLIWQLFLGTWLVSIRSELSGSSTLPAVTIHSGDRWWSSPPLRCPCGAEITSCSMECSGTKQSSTRVAHHTSTAAEHTRGRLRAEFSLVVFHSTRRLVLIFSGESLEEWSNSEYRLEPSTRRTSRSDDYPLLPCALIVQVHIDRWMVFVIMENTSSIFCCCTRS